MKIATITWFFDNYGTVLQAYALNTYLNTINGVKAKVVNYELKKDNLDIPFRMFSLDSIRKFYRKLINLKNKRGGQGSNAKLHYIKLRAELFEDFRKEIHMTKSIAKSDLNSLEQDFDVFICGSDQVWNPYFYDRSYFLDFINEKKKIAYAPSLGGSIIPFRLKGMYSKSLSSFYKLSVREEESCKLITALSRKECSVMPDPVFLLTQRHWRSVNNQGSDKGEKYILCYLLSDNFWYKKFIAKIGNRLDLDIKYIYTNGFQEYSENADVVCPGPKEFLNLICSAEFVVTDSFHGTCFSLLFNRDFVCLERFSKGKRVNENMRVRNLLSGLHLDDRFVTSKGNHVGYAEPNWSIVNSGIEEMRKRGASYLNNALNIEG